MRISDWSSDVCSSDLVNFADPYIVIGQTVLIRKGLIGTISNREQLDDPKYTIATKLGTTGDIDARKYFAKARIKAFESEDEATTETRNGGAAIGRASGGARECNDVEKREGTVAEK